MSRSIIDNDYKIFDASDEPASEEERDHLREYVSAVLQLKRLSFRDVQRESSGRITQSYVGGIVSGCYRNPTVEKLRALAVGLGVDEDEVFRVARGLPPSCAPKATGSEGAARILNTLKAAAARPDLIELLGEIIELSPRSQETVKLTVHTLKSAEAPTTLTGS